MLQRMSPRTGPDGVRIWPANPAALCRRRLLVAGALLPVLGGLHGRLQAATPPAGPAVLSVVGRITQPNVADRTDFDMAMLAALPQHSFETAGPWYARPHRFTGPLLRDVLAVAGAQGQWLRLQALNDYEVDMPVSDTQRWEVILARLLDNRPMAVRDKGPLFAIYPFASDPALRSAIYYGRSAWQLRTIVVR